MNNLKTIHTDVCILGAGPGGAAAALYLSQLGIPSVVVDKAVFPRDKICGDGLSGKVTSILNRIDPEIANRFRQKDYKTDSWGIRFIAPNRIGLDIPLKLDYENQMNKPVGFVCRRMDFDNFLVEEMKLRKDIQLIEGVSLDVYQLENDYYRLTSKNSDGLEVYAKLVVVANGAHSRFTKEIAGFILDPEHHYAGVRAYYKDVSGCHQHNFIELHFIKKALPGYFWIFPLPNGGANVGLGMLSNEVSRKKVNLRKLLEDTIANDPIIKERFKNASIEGPIEGYGLPLGSKKRKLHGERYMLVGDAAHLIDPFTGEGIGNAMYAGYYAAKRTAEAIKENNFSAAFLSAYDEDINRVLGPELRISYKLQKMVKYPWLFNLLNRLGARNKELKELMTCMFNDIDLRNKFRDPKFYFRLVFNRG
jgi:geranylgeranyl reductase family protein